MLTGNAAAAWGARLAEVDYVPAFPDHAADRNYRYPRALVPGRRDASQTGHDGFRAFDAGRGIRAAATGVRVFTATSSQGLVYAFEMLYAIAGLRLPLVLVNVSRALANPITLEPDHNDVLSARDTGFSSFTVKRARKFSTRYYWDTVWGNMQKSFCLSSSTSMVSIYRLPESRSMCRT